MPINKHANSWLESPLPSAGLPPHFWSTVDKAAPSRTTNQAVVLVAHNSEGNVCPIPVAAPEIYTKCEAATYDELGSQMIKQSRKNFHLRYFKGTHLRLCYDYVIHIALCRLGVFSVNNLYCLFG